MFLVDGALALMLLAGALFLGAVGLALIKTLSKKENDDDTHRTK